MYQRVPAYFINSNKSKSLGLLLHSLKRHYSRSTLLFVCTFKEVQYSILRLFYKGKLEWKTSKQWYKSSQLRWHSAWGKILCTSLSFLLLLTRTGSALTAHPDVLSPDAFDHISATVYRSALPPPEVSWHIKAPEGKLMWKCTIKMLDPHTLTEGGNCALKFFDKKKNGLFILTWKLYYDR